MRDSNVANAAKESAQDEFPHGLLDFCKHQPPAWASKPALKLVLASTPTPRRSSFDDVLEQAAEVDEVLLRCRTLG
jgi:hypothetical protein